MFCQVTCRGGPPADSAWAQEPNRNKSFPGSVSPRADTHRIFPFTFHLNSLGIVGQDPRFAEGEFGLDIFLNREI